MIGKEEIRNLIDIGFHPFLDYITRVVNIISNDEIDYALRDYILTDASREAVAKTPAAFLEALIELSSGFGVDTNINLARLVETAPVQPRLQTFNVAPFNLREPVPRQSKVIFREAHFALRRRLSRLRTREARERGLQLAAVAYSMRGLFQWVQSGPKKPNVDWQSGTDFMPRTHWTKTEKQYGFEQHDPEENDFAQWLLTDKLTPLKNTAKMNCWESVFYSAFVAGLVSKTWIQTAHRRAALNFQFTRSTESYFRTLTQGLNFAESFPYNSHGRITPNKGDILFWTQYEHVGVSLGRCKIDGKVGDYCMSLWHHKNKTFACIDLLEMPVNLQTELRFVPCPF